MDLGNACSGLNDDTLDELRSIVTQHEAAGGLLTQLMEYVGDKVESLTSRMPPTWHAQLQKATDHALNRAYTAAVKTQGKANATSRTGRALAWADGERWHKVATGVTGTLGGLGGLATTLADLPVTTTLILRSIQQIAAGHGEDIEAPEVRAQCLAVFGMSGPLKDDDDVDAGLWAVRTAVNGKMVAEVVKAILPRFGVVVSQKALAQATPFLGAIAGGAVNPIFTTFYQEMAHVHFRLRKLEHTQDREQLQACFERLVKLHRAATPG